MQKREEIIAEARRWLDTPYRHQHHMLGFGADCLGFIRGVGEACGVLQWDEDLFQPYRCYSEQPSPKTTLGVLNTFFKPTDDPLLADIACIAWRPELPMHLALLGCFQGRSTLIHALRTRGRVVEHGFSAEWPSLVHSWWSFPGLVT